MKEILKKLDKMQKDIDIIKLQLDQMLPQTKRMDRHIDFVHSIYQTVEQPFHFICAKASKLMGTSESHSHLEN